MRLLINKMKYYEIENVVEKLKRYSDDIEIVKEGDSLYLVFK